MKNVIVIGGDHYNALGVIRSLGEANIKPIFVLISDEKFCMSAHSKYISKLYRLYDYNSEKIISLLKKISEDYDDKILIIPTGDPIEKILDENYDILKDKFYLPNINNQEGKILECMDKNFQRKICEENNILYPKTTIIHLNKKFDNIIKKINYKVIIKPEVSADGNKADIVICDSTRIIDSLNEFKKKKYDRVMIQEFLNYDMEYAMMGISYKGRVIIPGINSNDFIYPSNRGNTSFSEMFPVSDFMFNIKNIVSMIEKLNFTGLFEVEVFKVGNKLYFNEMNFRNSANQYSYSGDKVPYINLYVQLVYGNSIENLKKTVDKHYFYCIEQCHLKNVMEGVISLPKCLCNINKSTKLILSLKDSKPVFFKLFHAIDRRLKK